MEKRKIVFSVLLIAIVAALLIAGGTMAWFTAKAEVVNEFTAGTVMIDVTEVGVYYGEDYDNQADMGNVNPGDCYEKEFNITNTGSKYALLRLKFAHSWEFDWEWLYENWEALCFTENDPLLTKPLAPYDPTQNQPNWDAFIAYVEDLTDPASAIVNDGNWFFYNGYWYYDGKLGPTGQQDDPTNVTIEYIKVCFDGPTMNNFFQSASYTLTTTVEAIQASNNASQSAWDGAISIYDPLTLQSGENWSGWGNPPKVPAP